MAYLSAILGKPVTDVDGAHMGVVRDVIASLHPEQRRAAPNPV